MAFESSLKKSINNLVPRVSLGVRGGRSLQRLESELPNTSTSETVEIRGFLFKRMYVYFNIRLKVFTDYLQTVMCLQNNLDLI